MLEVVRHDTVAVDSATITKDLDRRERFKPLQNGGSDALAITRARSVGLGAECANNWRTALWRSHDGFAVVEWMR
jgi:hypothetical protein